MAARLVVLGRHLHLAVLVQVFLFQSPQNVLSPFDHFTRHAGQPGHVDPIAFVRSAGHDLMQKDDFLLPFSDGHVQVPHAA